MFCANDRTANNTHADSYLIHFWQFIALSSVSGKVRFLESFSNTFYRWNTFSAKKCGLLILPCKIMFYFEQFVAMYT